MWQINWYVSQINWCRTNKMIAFVQTLLDIKSYFSERNKGVIVPPRPFITTFEFQSI